MRLLLCTLLALLLTLPAYAAVEPTRLRYLKNGEIILPDTLPQPIILDKITIPAEAVALLQTAAAACEALFGTFSFDTGHLTPLDLNGDGATDYILSSKGYICTDPRATFRGTKGEHYYFLISSGPARKLELFHDKTRAYDMRVEHYHARYPVVILTTPCTYNRKILKTYGETHLRWRGGKMAVILRNHGCPLPGTTLPPQPLAPPNTTDKPPEPPHAPPHPPAPRPDLPSAPPGAG